MKASKSLNDVVIHVIDDAFASQELMRGYQKYHFFYKNACVLALSTIRISKYENTPPLRTSFDVVYV